MSDTTIFYILGGVLVLSALSIAAIGLRDENFPSGRAFRAMVAGFGALVLATMSFAVLNAKSEGDKTNENHEAAARLNDVDVTKGEQEADAPEAGSASAQATPNQEPAAPSGPAQELKVSSPDTGALEYTPAALSAMAGSITIDYENPSPVPHSIAIESPDGEVLNESEVGANGTFNLSADVQAGEYLYYCTVPGHREGGMEGKLTVK